jgi:hypothetical protein
MQVTLEGLAFFFFVFPFISIVMDPAIDIYGIFVLIICKHLRMII